MSSSLLVTVHMIMICDAESYLELLCCMCLFMFYPFEIWHLQGRERSSCKALRHTAGVSHLWTVLFFCMFWGMFNTITDAVTKSCYPFIFVHTDAYHILHRLKPTGPTDRDSFLLSLPSFTPGYLYSWGCHLLHEACLDLSKMQPLLLFGHVRTFCTCLDIFPFEVNSPVEAVRAVLSSWSA